MISLRLNPHAAGPAFSYRVAGQKVEADCELAWLRPFASREPGRTLAALEPAAPSTPQEILPEQILFEGEAYLARRQRRLRCRRRPGVFELEVEELGAFRLTEAKNQIEVLAATAPAELLAEVVLGPLLALALARQGIFLLHASACELDGETWLFLGESGAGKSTLAARLGGRQLADDQAAVDAALMALWPDFPQPKLSPFAQAPLLGAGRRSLGGIALLEKAPATDEPALLEVDPMRAAAGIVRHTTAARCFDPPLLRAQLDFAVAVAAQIPCRRLLYPHHPAAPKKIRALLTQS